MEILLGGEERSKVIEIQDGWGGGGEGEFESKSSLKIIST